MRRADRTTALSGVLIVLGLSLAAPAHLTRAESTAVLTGVVADAEGRPLAGARVTLSGNGVGTPSTLTRVDGTYRFPALRPFRQYRVAVEEPGYRAVEYEGMRLEPDRTRAISFRMKKPGERDVAVLVTRDPFPYEDLVRAFKERLAVPVRVIDLDAEPDPAETVRRVAAERPNLILGAGLRAARLIRWEVREVPSILTLIDDPRRYDLEAANLCFIANNPDPDELLRRVVALLPQARDIGLVYDAQTSSLVARDLREAVERRGLRAALRPCYGPKEMSAELETLRGRVDALLVPRDPLASTSPALERITSWAQRNHVPVIGPGPEWVRHGALFSYSLPPERLGEEAFRIAAQILFHTGQPADFHLRTPEHALLAVNRETAAKLGVSIPADLAVDLAF